MNTNAAPESLPTTLHVRALMDPVVEAHGFGPASVYVEYCWLGVLGPTATFLYRRLGAVAGAAGDVVAAVDLVDVGVSLGVGEGMGRNSILARAIGRLVRFGVAEWRGDVLAVRRAVAPLTTRQLSRLSYSARVVHERIVEGRPRPRR